MNISRFRALRGLSLGIVAALAGSLSAQTLNWTSGSGNVLTNSANWGGTAPNSTHTLTFNNVTSGNANVTLAGGSLSINSMAFNNTAMRVSAALGTNLGNGVITFNNAITLITASNSANVNFTSVNTTSTNVTVPTLTINLNYTGAGTINVDATSLVNISGNTNNSFATLTGTGGLIKTGAGMLRLGNNHTYSGGFELQSGSVEVTAITTGSSSAFGTGTLTLSGGTLSSNSTANRTIENNTRFNGTVTLGSATNTGLLIFQAGTATLLSDSHLVTASNVNLNQSLSGAFKLTKSGTGNLALNSSMVSSTYSGGFELVSGNVLTSNSTVASGGILTNGAFGTGTLTLSGGTILSTGTNRTIHNSITLNGTVAMYTNNSTPVTHFISALGGGTTTVAADSNLNVGGDNAGVTLSWQQVISGSGNLTKTGAGTLSITDSNPNFTGNLSILGGTVSVDAPGNLGANTLSRTTIIDNATLRFTGTTASGNNRTYSLGANGATFDVTSSGVSINGAIMDYADQSGSLTKTGSGTLTLNATNSYTGGTTVSAGTLQATSATLPGNVVNNASLIFAQDSDGTFAGDITGTGTVTKSGTGVLALTGTHDYSGLTTVSGGGLKVEGSLAGALTIESGGTLSGSGTITGATSIAGTHSPGSSPGIQTFGDNLTYQADATVNWELSANTATQGDPTAVYDQINVTGTLDFSGSTSLALSFSGAGSGVNWNDAFWDANRSWKIYDTASVSNFGNLSLVTSNWADGSGNLFDTVLAGAGFSLAQVGNDIFLNYAAAPIPEPATAAALLGAAILALALQRRHRAPRP